MFILGGRATRAFRVGRGTRRDGLLSGPEGRPRPPPENEGPSPPRGVLILNTAFAAWLSNERRPIYALFMCPENLEEGTGRPQPRPPRWCPCKWPVAGPGRPWFSSAAPSAHSALLAPICMEN